MHSTVPGRLFGVTSEWVDPVPLQIAMSRGAGIVIQDSTGRVIGANQRACEMLRFSWAQIAGAEVSSGGWEALAEDGSPLNINDIPALVSLRTKQPVRDFVMGVRTKSNPGTTWLRVSSKPALDSEGEVVGVLALMTPVEVPHGEGSGEAPPLAPTETYGVHCGNAASVNPCLFHHGIIARMASTVFPLPS